MRHSTSFTFISLFAVTACSTYSATKIVVESHDAGADAGDTGGKSSTGDAGGSSSTAGASMGGISNQAGASAGGVSSGGSSPAKGGASSTGGVTASGGASASGGNSSPGGASSTGGIVSTGGVSATGGAPNNGGASATGGAGVGGATATGGASACAKDADCVNLDPTNCSYTCANPGTTGVCKPTATLTPTQCATSACDDKPISGFWDASGKPHIAYAWTETDGTASIRMQQVKADGTVDGAAVPYKLPTVQPEPILLSANSKGSSVGLIWDTTITTQTAQAPIVEEVVDFAVTDINGTYSNPTEVVNYGNHSPVGSSHLWLRVTPAELWLALGILQPNAPPLWQASVGSSIGGWTTLSPVLYGGEFASDVVGSTLMMTGSDCSPGNTSCQTSFKLQRFSASSLSSIGSLVSLSQNFQSNVWPAMGPFNGMMALLWTETQSPGQLFRTLIKEDGTFEHPIDTIQSAISPRAIVQSASFGSLLVGVITSGANYQLVAQRLDSNLGLVGNPLPIAAALSVDVTGIEVHSSSDGTQVLVTYRQAGARYRLLGTNLCGG